MYHLAILELKPIRNKRFIGGMEGARQPRGLTRHPSLCFKKIAFVYLSFFSVHFFRGATKAALISHRWLVGMRPIWVSMLLHITIFYDFRQFSAKKLAFSS
jgi:hypothetical protein